MTSSILRTTAALSASLVGAATLVVVAAAPASASGNCDNGSYKRVTARSNYFSKADALFVDNRKGKGTLTASIAVGEAHTSSKATSVSLTASVEAEFFGFAKASASTTYGVTLQSSVTMQKTYTGTISVPKGQTSTLQWGFSRISQTIQKYHLVQRQGKCVIQPDKTVTLSAPYQKAYRTV